MCRCGHHGCQAAAVERNLLTEPRSAWCQLVFAGKTGRVLPDDEAHNVQKVHTVNHWTSVTTKIQLIRWRDDEVHNDRCQRLNWIPVLDMFSTRTAMKYRHVTHVSLVLLNVSATGTMVHTSLFCEAVQHGGVGGSRTCWTSLHCASRQEPRFRSPSGFGRASTSVAQEVTNSSCVEGSL